MMLVSVVIPTKDRPLAVVDTVASIFACSYQDFEVFVVDQSANDATRKALARFALDQRFHYVRNHRPWPGAASSRNVGIALSNGEVVAHIDDDVTVREDWMGRLVADFEADPDLQFIAGKLSAPTYDTNQGFIPASDPAAEQPPLNQWTMAIFTAGANFAMRRSLFDRVGGYDDHFGPGTKYPGGDDASMALRISRSGAKWKASSEIEVVHTHGFRPSADFTPLLKGYMVGTGASFGVAARRGDVASGLWFLGSLLHASVVQVVPNILLRRKPSGFGWVRDRAVGFYRGLRLSPQYGFVSGEDLRRLRQDLHAEPPLATERI